MKKIIICLMMFGAAGAYATGENERATSMGYVNEELDTRQDKFDKLGSDTAVTYSGTTDGAVGTRTITGDLGAESNTSSASLPTVGAVNTKLDNKQDKLDFAANTVLMNTGTAGAPAAKGIYDDSGSYLDQADSLIDAATFNAALQNAINSEFTCAERKDPNDPTSKCLLFNIFAPTPHASGKNLFNIKNAKVLYRNGTIQETKTETGFLLTNSNTVSNFILVEIGDISDFIDKTIRLSYTTTCGDNNNTGFVYCDEQGYNRALNVLIRTILVTEPENNQTKLGIRLYANQNPSIDCEYSNIQVEYGNTATAYEPYQNLYVPQNQQ